MDGSNIDEPSSEDEDKPKTDTAANVILSDNRNKSKNTLTLSKASMALKFLYDEVLALNDYKYRIDLW